MILRREKGSVEPTEIPESPTATQSGVGGNGTINKRNWYFLKNLNFQIFLDYYFVFLGGI